MQTLNLPSVSTTNMTPATVIAQIPTSFYGNVPVGLALTSSPTVLIASSADLTNTSNSPGFVAGSLYTYVLVAVKRYSISNAQDTNSATNFVNVDYVPGASWNPAPVGGAAPFPSRNQVIADAIVALNAAITAYNTANSKSQSTYATIANAAVSNQAGAAGGGQIDGSAWWGLYKSTTPGTVIQSNFVLDGAYVLNIVNHYVINVPHGGPIIAEYVNQQTAGALITASGVTMQSNPFPGLFLDSSNASDANISSTLLPNAGVVAAGTYDVHVVYNYTCVLPATNIAPAITTSIKTLEQQTPQYLLTQLIALGVITGSASSYALQAQTPANAPLANQLLGLDPTIIYNIVSVMSFTVDYTSNVANAATIVVRTTAKTTLEAFMQDPSLSPIFVNTPTNNMVVLVGTKGNNSTFLSPAMTMTAVGAKLVASYGQTAPNYTLYWGLKAYNTITCSMPGSSMAPFVDNMPQGDVYANYLSLAATYFGLTATSTVDYALFGTTPASDVTKQFGLSLGGTQGVTKTITAGDDSTLTVQTMLYIQLAVQANAIQYCWVPQTFNVAQAITYFLDNSSTNSTAHLPLSAASSGHIWTLAENGTAGSKTANSATESPVFMGWQMMSSASADLMYIANTTPSGDVTINTDSFGSLELGEQSLNYTAQQYQQWALHSFTQLDAKATYVTCTKVTNQVPAFVVTANSSIVPLLTDAQLAGLTPAQSTNNVYIKQAMEVVIKAPATVVRTPIDAFLPLSFTTYDLVNYALPIFGLTGITSYAFYESNDPIKHTLGIMETISEVETAFESDDPLCLQMIASDYVRVTVNFNGAPQVLLPMPTTCNISDMLEVAAVTLNVPLASLEVVTPASSSVPVMPTDLLSVYTTPATTAGGVGTATFTIQTIVKTNVIVYDSQTGFVTYTKKLSQSLFVSQLITAYAAALSIAPSYQIKMFTHQNNVFVPPTAALLVYERAVQPSDAPNLDPNDSSAVTTVVEFTVQKTQQTASITVQSLFNASAAVTLTIPLYSTASQLAAAAVAAFGNLSSSATFGVTLAGTNSLLAPTATVSSSNVYQLVETTSPLVYNYVAINYVDRTQASAVAVVPASTALNALVGFNAKFETMSTSIGGTAISDYTATVAATIASAKITNGQLNLYDSLLAPIVVHANIAGSLRQATIPVNSKISDMLTAFSVVGSVTVTQVSDSKVANPSDYVISFTAPYTFNVVQNPTTYNVTVNYGTQSTVVKATASMTGSQMIAAAVAALSLDATKQYQLSLTAGGAALDPTVAQTWSSVSAVYMSQAGASAQTTLVVGASVGILGLLAALLVMLG